MFHAHNYYFIHKGNTDYFGPMHLKALLKPTIVTESATSHMTTQFAGHLTENIITNPHISAI